MTMGAQQDVEPAPRAPTAGRAERLISLLLLGGGVASIALIALGLGWYAAQTGLEGSLTRPAPVFTSLRAVGDGLSHRPVSPLAVSALGLLLLVATPVLGVGAAVLAFWRAGDRRYAAIAAVVLALLLISFSLAGGAG